MTGRRRRTRNAVETFLSTFRERFDERLSHLLETRRVVVDAGATPDLGAWLRNDRVVRLDSTSADRWLEGKESFDDYFASAVRRAKQEAEEDVDEALSHS